ncbi:flagellar protein FliT [Exiguobacterium sp. NG55]|uniref:flagellar protein FliT n=1 Tax=Exiguobacterium sp. NG55 TaxID=375477 RepID=UPI0004DF66B5|nr:flagellar protein FliT [Exiguobacterium sp. NG55]
MRPIDEIILKTQRLKELLAQVPEEPTYDTWMEQIHELLDDREQLLAAHGPDLEKADQTVLRQLVDDSQKIARLIEAEHQRLGISLGTVRQERKASNSYTDPYKDIETNFSGLFDMEL